MSSVLVTGASSGIGAAFARALHRSGRSVVLVGRDDAALRRVIDGNDEHGAVELLELDLNSSTGMELLKNRLRSRERPIDLIVHAAGMTASRPFGEGSLEAEIEQLDVNVNATVRVLHSAVTSMAGRGGGTIILIGSTAAIWSQSSYAATKTWQHRIVQSIGCMSSTTGVKTLLVIPGFTRTELHERAGVDNSAIPRWMWLTPEQVAEESLRSLRRGRSTCIPTLRYRVLVRILQLMPLSLRTLIIKRIAPLRVRAAT